MADTTLPLLVQVERLLSARQDLMATESVSPVKPPFRHLRDLDPSYTGSLEHWSGQLRAIVNRQAARLRERGASGALRWLAGRTLVYWSGYSIHDGLAEGETDFYDVHDCPPVDLLMGMLLLTGEQSHRWNCESPVLAWVPQRLVPLAEKGMSVMPTWCVEWVENAAADDRWQGTELGEALGRLSQPQR